MLVVVACTTDPKNTAASNDLVVTATALTVGTYADSVQSDTQQMAILSVSKEFKAAQQDSLCLMRAQINVPKGIKNLSIILIIQINLELYHLLHISHEVPEKLHLVVLNIQ